MDSWNLRKLIIRSFKVALGSSVAIAVAQWFHLDYATSAGTITLLSIVTTKWETLHLSVYRIISFFISAYFALVFFHYIDQEWIAYGLFIFFIVLILELMGWNSTISVNAVIGFHFLSEKNFSTSFIINEFYLVLIGISIAILFNLFHGNQSHKSLIIQKMRFTEKQLQIILKGLGDYITNTPSELNVWDTIKALEHQLSDFIILAVDYQNNTFHSHPGYYINYFEMRVRQLNILHNLHYEMKKIKSMPKQSHQVSDFIYYLIPFIEEHNVPDKQQNVLSDIFSAMKEENLPVSREEFESRSILYHILMDLDDFLLCKKRFIDEMTDQQRELYWTE